MENPLIPVILSILRKLITTFAGLLLGWGLLEGPLSAESISAIALFLVSTGWGLWNSHKDTIKDYFKKG